MDKPAKRVMIVGGGNIGRRLAKRWSTDYQVKLIEYNKKACASLAAELTNTLVLHGDGTDENLLLQENVGEVDVFCALTNDDENNIMSALLAKQGGARKVIALINRSAYVGLVQGGKIDIALPRRKSRSARCSPMCARAMWRRCIRCGAARRRRWNWWRTATVQSSKVVGRRIDEIDLPKGATIGAIVRGEQVIMAHHDTVIEAEDHVIVFVIDKQMVRKVEKLFQVGLGFF